MLYGFSLCIINCLRVSKRMSEYNKSIFRVVDGKIDEYRCAHVLYVGYVILHITQARGSERV